MFKPGAIRAISEGTRETFGVNISSGKVAVILCALRVFVIARKEATNQVSATTIPVLASFFTHPHTSPFNARPAHDLTTLS